MKPANLKTKIFLDSGDPQETVAALEVLGFLDGQTTNPTLIAKNPEARTRLESGMKFRPDEIWTFYKDVVSQISRLLPNGSISIEVYADQNSTKQDLLHQANKFQSWIPNSHIKFPVLKAGLEAVHDFVQDGGKANVTLVFDEEQAAAVHNATKGCTKGQVFLSPFIGRLDDINLNGMDLIQNCLKFYRQNNSQVEVLGASVRDIDQFTQLLKLEADIITAPLKILQEWAEVGFPLQPSQEYAKRGQQIPYQELDTSKSFAEFNIQHDLTDKGIERFAKDWNNLLA